MKPVVDFAKPVVDLFKLIFWQHWAVNLSLFFLVLFAYVLDYNFIFYAKENPNVTFYMMLLSLSFLIKPISSLIQWGRGKRAAHIYRQSMEEKLNNLNPDQKGYLVPFVVNNVSSIKIDSDDGVGMSLAHVKILYMPSAFNQSNVINLNNMSFCINSYALDYLKKNPHLLSDYIRMPLTNMQRLGI